MQLTVDLADPIDIMGSLEMFRRSGDDLIDRWDGQRLLRAVPAGPRRWIAVLARPVATAVGARFAVTIEDAADAEVARRAVRSTFVDRTPEFARLCADDAVIARYEHWNPGIHQIRQLDLFTALVRCISAQQVNLRWAVTTRRRLAEAFGVACELDGETVYGLDPWRIAEADPAAIRDLQFTTAKSRSIVAVAQAVAAGTVTTERLDCLSDSEVIERLSALRGIGRWSAEWILARTLGRACVVAGDLGVRKAVGLAYRDDPAPSEREVRALTRHWGAAAGTAQAVLLHALGEGELRSPPRPRRSSAAPRGGRPARDTDGASIETSAQTSHRPSSVEPRGRGRAARSGRS